MVVWAEFSVADTLAIDTRRGAAATAVTSVTTGSVVSGTARLRRLTGHSTALTTGTTTLRSFTDTHTRTHAPRRAGIQPASGLHSHALGVPAVSMLQVATRKMPMEGAALFGGVHALF